MVCASRICQGGRGTAEITSSMPGYTFGGAESKYDQNDQYMKCSKKLKVMLCDLGRVGHTCNLSTQEDEAGGFL